MLLESLGRRIPDSELGILSSFRIKMRNVFVVFIIVSMLTTFTIGNVYYQKKQFYPTVVFLTKHKPYYALIVIQCFMLLLIFSKIISWIFFGNIQRTEMDNVFTRIMYTSFDMCLLFTFFQEEMSTKYLFLFSLTLFTKAFHWLLEGRVDLMERTPVIRPSFHVRTLSFITVLSTVDVFNIMYFYWGTDVRNIMSIAVGAEYWLLLFELITIFMHYVIQVIDSMRDTPWDKKTLYLLYVDVVVGVLRVFFYMEYAPILFKHHPIPLFIIRPIYLNLRFLKKTVSNLILSSRAIRLMNNAFPDVSAADLVNSNDAVCIICREDMKPQNDPPTIPEGSVKRLPCNHMFHTNCLRNWFQRQQTCPTCRLNILRRLGRANRSPRRAAAGDGVRQPEGQQLPQGRRAPGGSTQIRIDIQRSVGGSASESARLGGTSDFQSSALYFPQNMQFPVPLPPGQATNGLPPVFCTPPLIIPGEQFLRAMTGGAEDTPLPARGEGAAGLQAEAQLRAGMESRAEALRRIQVLLDAAILQMNSYLMATVVPPPTAGSSKASAPADDLDGDAAPAPSSVEKTALTENSGKKHIATGLIPAPQGPGSSQDSDDLSVIRQRRLEKLSAGPSAVKVDVKKP